MRINYKQELTIQLQGENTIEMDSFIYFASIVSKGIDTYKDIISHIKNVCF